MTDQVSRLARVLGVAETDVQRLDDVKRTLEGHKDTIAGIVALISPSQEDMDLSVENLTMAIDLLAVVEKGVPRSELASKIRKVRVQVRAKEELVNDTERNLARERVQLIESRRLLDEDKGHLERLREQVRQLKR